MQIILYQNKSEKNKINKDLTQVEVLTGNLRNDTSLQKPSIRIERNDPTGFNYCYIPQFNRYYFVDDVIINRNNILTLTLSVDVLESFKTQILAQSAIINKNTTDNNKYLNDENWLTTVKRKTDIVNFSNGFLESGEFILITAGG